MSAFLGIDGGGSKTAAIVVDENMEPLGEGRAGPSNHLRVGIEVARDSVERATLQACATAGVKLTEIDYAYCGIAGADHPVHRQTLVESLRNLFSGEQFTVDSDARVALAAGVGIDTPGVVIIAGTGSVAFGRNKRGFEARAGGWGPTLGDEGSGYSIARRGLAAIVRAHDGRGPKTLITDLLCRHHGMCEPRDLPVFVYAPTTHADDIAVYFGIVIEAAMRGDAVAEEIVASEGRDLGLTVAAVIRKLEMQDEAVSVAFTGGAFTAGELLTKPLAEQLLQVAPAATVHAALERPVLGAARMAIAASEKRRETRV